MTSSLTQLSFSGSDVILRIEVTSTPTQFSLYGNDVILQLEVASPPMQLSFHGNDVSNRLRHASESSRIFEKNFQPIRTKQLLDITCDQK